MVRSNVVEVEHLSGGSIKGSILLAHIDWVRHHGARDEVVEFFESLPPALRQQAGVVRFAAWYPFTTLMEIDRRVADRFGHGDPVFLQELGAWSARHTLAGPHAIAAQPVHEILRRAALHQRESQDFGSVEYLPGGASSGRMIRCDDPSFSPLYCAGALGFYRECIRMQGGADAAAWESACQCRGDVSCVVDMSWR